MAEIKIDETHLEFCINIKRRQFDALLVTHATWLHLDSPFESQLPRLNRNDAHSCVSSALEHQRSFFEFGNEKPLMRRVI